MDNRPLIRAVREGDLNAAQAALSQDVSEEELDEALSLALLERDLEMAMYLVSQGADPNLDDGDILILASYEGDLPKVKSLLAMQYLETINKEEALIAATEGNHLDTVAYLLSRSDVPWKADSAGVNTNEGQPLYEASAHGNLAMVKLLISQGAVTDRDALLIALANSHLFTALHLLREGADPPNRDLFLEALDEDTLTAIDLIDDNDSIDAMAVTRLQEKKDRIRDAIFSIAPTLGGLVAKY